MTAAADPGAALEAARASGLIPAGKPLLVMLSGGADSVCLLDVALQLGAEVTALHANYGLRAAAEDDERHCRELCARLGVELIVEAAPLPDDGNVQALAREARYRLAELHASGDYAAAHTASDQAETVLYRLAVSPGRRPLLGMAPRRGRLVRPLLAATGAETRAHCRARGLEWREDASNRDPRFARARVRHGLLDVLREVAPGAEHTIAETSAQLRDEAAALDAAVDAALAGLGGGPAVEGEALAALGPGLSRLVLRRLAERETGAPHPLSRADVDAVLALAGTTGSRSLDVGKGLRAIAEYGTLRFHVGDQPVPIDPVVLTIPGTARFGAWEVEAGLGGGGEVALDADALGDLATIRAWRDGDRMRPVGLGGTKSLQDLFTDRKIPRELRRTLPVIEAQGEIAWIAGVALSERFAPNPATKTLVSLSARLKWPVEGNPRRNDSQVQSGVPFHRRTTAPTPAIDSPPVTTPPIGEILVQSDDLAHRVKALAEQISRDYAGRSVLLIGVLKGAMFFLSDLMRQLEVDCEVDFMAVASYGSSTSSSGVVRILKDLDGPIEGRDVLIVEDIVDSGLTLSYLLRTLRAREPASVEVCALLTKPERRKVDLPIRYVGFEIPNRFVIGYGLDHAERFRNLPYVAVLDGPTS